jgi:hypothetical protein
LSTVPRPEQREKEDQRGEHDHEDRDPIQRHVVGETKRRREDVATHEIPRPRVLNVGVVEQRHHEGHHEFDGGGHDTHGVGEPGGPLAERGDQRPEEGHDDKNGQIDR